MSDKHANSHRITIFRTGNFLTKTQPKEVASFLSQSRESIGSYFEKRTSPKIGSGLSREEAELLMPEFIDRVPGDREFNEKVTEFFRDLLTPVPFNGGIELEIGLTTNNEKPVSKDNMPLNASDYIRYRHALKHPFVAASKEEAAGNPLKKFYIFDPLNVQNKNFKANVAKDAAMTKYLQVKEDQKQVDMMLSLLGIDVREFTGKDAASSKLAKLRTLVETESDKFNAVYDEGDLEIRATIANMVRFKVLKQIGKRYVVTESNEEIGATLDEAIYFFKDDTNSDKVIVLKALEQEEMTKPVTPIQKQTQV